MITLVESILFLTVHECGVNTFVAYPRVRLAADKLIRIPEIYMRNRKYVAYIQFIETSCHRTFGRFIWAL